MIFGDKNAEKRKRRKNADGNDMHGLISTGRSFTS